VNLTNAVLPGWVTDRIEISEDSKDMPGFRYLDNCSASACVSTQNVEQILRHVSNHAAIKGIAHPCLYIFGARAESQGILEELNNSKASFPLTYYVPPNNQGDGKIDLNKILEREEKNIWNLNQAIQGNDVILPFFNDFAEDRSNDNGRGLLIPKQSAIIKSVESVCQNLNEKHGIEIKYVRIPILDHGSLNPEQVDSFNKKIEKIEENPNAYLHFHCKEGSGRTTGLWLRKHMYTANALQLSYEDFMKKYKTIIGKKDGGNTLFGVRNKQYSADRIKGMEERDNALRSFYTYAQQRAEGEHDLQYSTWLTLQAIV
jgi:hypothetical protein